MLQPPRRFPRFWLVPFLALAAAAWLGDLTAARAVVRRDDVPQSVYAALGAQKQFAPVGRVDYDYGYGFQPLGSAVLINKNYIMSAGHVFAKDTLRGARRIRFVLGHKVYNIDFKKPGVVHVNPHYNSVTLANDISVVRLARPVTGVTPAKLYAGRAESGQVGTMVGFGDSGTGLTGDENSDAKLGGTNAIDVALKNVLETDFDSPTDPSVSVFGSPTPTPLEGQLGPGDSGGGLFIQSNGAWVVAGINDFGEQGFGMRVSDTYGWISGFTRVSSYISYIQSIAGVKTVRAAPAKVPAKK